MPLPAATRTSGGGGVCFREFASCVFSLDTLQLKINGLDGLLAIKHLNRSALGPSSSPLLKGFALLSRGNTCCVGR